MIGLGELGTLLKFMIVRFYLLYPRTARVRCGAQSNVIRFML